MKFHQLVFDGIGTSGQTSRVLDFGNTIAYKGKKDHGLLNAG